MRRPLRGLSAPLHCPRRPPCGLRCTGARTGAAGRSPGRMRRTCVRRKSWATAIQRTACSGESRSGSAITVPWQAAESAPSAIIGMTPSGTWVDAVAAAAKSASHAGRTSCGKGTSQKDGRGPGGVRSPLARPSGLATRTSGFQPGSFHRSYTRFSAASCGVLSSHPCARGLVAIQWMSLMCHVCAWWLAGRSDGFRSDLRDVPFESRAPDTALGSLSFLTCDRPLLGIAHRWLSMSCVGHQCVDHAVRGRHTAHGPAVDAEGIGPCLAGSRPDRGAPSAATVAPAVR